MSTTTTQLLGATDGEGKSGVMYIVGQVKDLKTSCRQYVRTVGAARIPKINPSLTTDQRTKQREREEKPDWLR